MSPIQSPTFQPSATVTIDNSTECKITNLLLGNTGDESSHPLVDNLKQLRIRAREMADLKYCFISNESSINYLSIYRGTCENLIDLNFTGKTLYIQANKDSVTIEIAEYY
jgi:hypothetical protein